MPHATSEYQTEVDYPEICFPFQSPQRVRFLLLVQGVRAPQITKACDLGFGMGLSLGLTAAAQPDCRWWGTDFSASQVAFARKLTEALSPAPILHDKSFEDLAASIEILPEFDFIFVHGIWSWVSGAIRKSIIEIIARRLRPGGVLYLSYNSFPGWAPISPIQKFLMLHAERNVGNDRGGPKERLTKAITFARELSEVAPQAYEANPGVKVWLDSLSAEDPAYLVGEYFTSSWAVHHFHEVAADLSLAQLDYAGYATAQDIPDVANLRPDQSAFLGRISDNVVREATKDLMLNRRFRRDLWVKGAESIDVQERDAQLRQFRVVPIVPRKYFTLVIPGSFCEITLPEHVYGPIFEYLCSEGYRPKSLDEIDRWIGSHFGAPAALSWSTAVEACCMLLGGNFITVAAPDADAVDRARQNCDVINKGIVARVHAGSGEYLASPVAASPIGVSRLHLFLIAAQTAGVGTRDVLRQYLRKAMADNRQAFVRDGQPVQEEQKIVAELDGVLTSFIDDFAPLYKALGVMR